MYIPLSGGAYQSRSVIAACQRSLNLYVEPLPQQTGEPIQHTHYPTPGLTLLSVAPASPSPEQSVIRCLYRATSLNLYAVANQSVYYIDPTWKWNLLGTLNHTLITDMVDIYTPVSMNDNGSVLLIGDGTPDGWWVDLTLPLASQVVNHINTTINTGWLGADVIGYLDTFFICNSPGTDIFYISMSYPTAASFTAAYQVDAATPVGGGPGSLAGYAVGDVLYLNDTGGTVNNTGVNTNASITVYDVDTGGGILQQQVTYGGVVGTQPTPPVTTTGGTGFGATFDLTYATGTGAFDPLNFATKSAMTDNLVAAVAVHRIVWLLGTSSYELFQDTGGDGTITGSFPFSLMYGAFGNWGCAAKYSVCTMANMIFWLSHDQWGHGVFMRGAGLSAERISTYAIETQIANYPTISDAVSYVYQQAGHLFYITNFLSANGGQGATWAFDISTNEWAERCYIDGNGLEWRHRVNTAAEAYGTVVCGDWQNGNLYKFDLSNGTDNGQPVKRLRTFPHLLDMQNNKRVVYSQLIANMQTSNSFSIPNQVFVNTDFQAADGTLLQNYSNVNDVNATFTPIDNTNSLEIVGDALLGASYGTTSYQVGGVPTSADYSVQFQVGMSRDTWTGSNGPAGNMYAIARANSSNLGYQAMVNGDGTLLSLEVSLAVMGGATYTLPLGGLTSGYWQLILTCTGTTITLAVTRSQDGLTLSPLGLWGADTQPAFTVVDGTYAGPGVVLIGANYLA